MITKVLLDSTWITKVCVLHENKIFCLYIIAEWFLQFGTLDSALRSIAISM